MLTESFRFELFAITAALHYTAAKIVKIMLQAERMIVPSLEQNLFLIEKPTIFAKNLNFSANRH
jgi:hypothetical protein